MLGQAIALGLVSALGRLDGRILGISMLTDLLLQLR